MRAKMTIRAAAFAVLIAGFAGAALAQDESPVAAVTAEEAPSVAPAAPVAPWYQDFTQDGSRYDLSGLPVRGGEATVDIPGGSNWGVRLGFEGTPGGGLRSEGVEWLSAGAYFKVTPRVRVGGELGFRAEQGDPASLRPNDEIGSSQVKLESAFRF